MAKNKITTKEVNEKLRVQLCNAIYDLEHADDEKTRNEALNQIDILADKVLKGDATFKDRVKDIGLGVLKASLLGVGILVGYKLEAEHGNPVGRTLPRILGLTSK